MCLACSQSLSFFLSIQRTMPEMKRDGHKHVAQWDDVKERACERFMNSTPPVLSRFFQLRDKCKKRGRREQFTVQI